MDDSQRPAPAPSLLTPQQAEEVRRLHTIGLFSPAEVARMVGVPLERILRSFRLADGA